MANERKTSNFYKALGQLEEFLLIPVENSRDKAGVIQAFEFTYELSWKVIQSVAATQGISSVSPRSAFMAGLSIGLLLHDEEERWLQMINDRNATSHIYREELAEQIFERVKTDYLELFHRLKTRLEGAEFLVVNGSNKPHIDG